MIKRKFIFNPSTGRWIDYTKPPGSLLKPRTSNDIRYFVLNPNTRRYVDPLKNIGQTLSCNSNIFNSLDIFPSNINISNYRCIGKAKSRTQPLLYAFMIKFPGYNTPYNIFAKISPSLMYPHIPVEKTPTFNEILLHKITNKLIQLKVLDSFVFCYNHILKTQIHVINSIPHTILLTEDVSNYTPLYHFIKSKKEIPECVIFEILYTLHTMSQIGLFHMDLHANNIYVKKLPRAEYIKYELSNNGKDFFHFTVKTTHVVKIIDLDGGSKRKTNIPNLKPVFKNTTINNIFSITGMVHKLDPKSNLLKFIHTIVHKTNTFNIMSNNLQNLEFKDDTIVKRNSKTIQKLKNLGVVNMFNRVPFSSSLNVNMPPGVKYNKTFLYKYGFLVNNSEKYIKNIQYYPIQDNIIQYIQTIFTDMYEKKLFQSNHVVNTTYSQRGLYM